MALSGGTRDQIAINEPLVAAGSRRRRQSIATLRDRRCSWIGIYNYLDGGG